MTTHVYIEVTYSAIPVVYLRDLVTPEPTFNSISVGDAKYTLIDPERLILELEHIGNEGLDEEDGTNLIDRLRQIPEGILVAVTG